MNLNERLGVIGVGIALLIPGLGAGWKAASMRGDLFGKWNRRVDLAFNGLSEGAATSLLNIQQLIRDFVVEGSVTFDPLRVVREPSDLRAPMRRFLHILRVRDRLRRRFSTLLGLGPALLVADAIYIAGLVLAVLDLSETVNQPVLGRIGLGMGSAGAAGLFFGFITYAYLQQRLSGAELLSRADASV